MNINIINLLRLELTLHYVILDGDIFYLAVWGHGSYSKGKLTIGGMNFKTAKKCNDRGCENLEEHKSTPSN